MARLKATAVIVVRFPPPVPKDFGRGVRDAIRNRLPKGADCCTVNTGALPGGRPGWAIDIRLMPKDGPAASHAVAEVLRGEPAGMGATVEVSELRGPVDVPVPPTPAARELVRGLLFPSESGAGVSLFLTVPGAPGGTEEVVAAVTAAVAPHGRVTHAARPSTVNLTVRVEDGAAAPGCVEAAALWLAAFPGGTLAVVTQSRPAAVEVGGRLP